MLKLEQLQFYKPSCRIYAPSAQTIPAIDDLMHDFDNRPVMVGQFFHESLPTQSLDNIGKYDPDISGGAGLIDPPEESGVFLDPAAVIEHGNGFCVKPDGELCFFRFNRISPHTVFTGLQRIFVNGQSYHLHEVTPADFERTLRTEDVASLRRFRNATIGQRAEDMRRAVFDWVVDLRRSMSRTKVK